MSSAGRRSSYHHYHHHHPTAAQAAATQDTLNYALRNVGSKQKAWMTAPDHHAGWAPPKPRQLPKPPVLPSNGHCLPFALDSASPAADTSHEAQPASNSTSPYLANTVYQRSGQRVPSPTVVLLSPSPSEEASVQNGPTPSTLSTSYTEPSAAETQETQRASSTYTPDAPLEAGFLEQMRQAASKRPAEPETRPTDKRSRSGGGGTCSVQVIQPATANSLPRPPSDSNHNASQRTASPALGQTGHRMRQMQAHTSSFAQQSQYPLSSGVHNHIPWQQQANGTPPQAQTPFRPPDSLALADSQQQIQGTQAPGHGSFRQIREETNSESTWYTADHCRRALRQFRLRHLFNSKYQTESRRFNVLQEAVEKKDWSYLTLHQYFCLTKVDPNSLPSSIWSEEHLQSGLKLFDCILDTNDSISLPVLQFFAEFPFPLATISAIWPQRWEIERQNFLVMIRRSVNFGHMCQFWTTRAFPPLMHELHIDLGIPSPLFQRLVFTSMHRRIFRRGPEQGSIAMRFETQALNIFLAHQDEYYSRGFQISPAMISHHRNQDFEKWGGQLRKLNTRFGQTMGSHPRTSIASMPTSAAQDQNNFANTDGSQATPAHAQTTSWSSQNTMRQPPTRNSGVPRGGPPNSQPSHQATHQPPYQAAHQPLHQPPQQSQHQPQHQSLHQQIYQPPRQPLYQPHQPPHQPPHQQIHQPVPPATSSSLFPPPGVFQPQQRQANPARFGIHLAHLRSPTLQAQSLESLQSPLYQFVDGFVLAPTRFTEGGRGIQEWTFNLTTRFMDSIPKQYPGPLGAPPTRLVDANKLTVRLRCVKWASSSLRTDSDWATADTSWLPYSFFTLNHSALEPRRKLHHGKDLPIDITTQLKEGKNKLQVAIMQDPTDTSHLQYLVAAEIVLFKQYDAIVAYVKKNCYISDQDIRAEIKRKLSPADDDDVIVTDNTLTITLYDPFSASKMCDTFVRSRTCLHNNCFDLETFLQTRQRKGDVSVADQWRCPICNVDARPQNLIVDGFLEDVRTILTNQSLPETRAIVVAQDGTWKVKEETCDPNVQDRQSPDCEAPAPIPCRSSLQAGVQIIDLSD